MIVLSYVLLGISLAAPMGPVNAAQVNKGLRLGFYHSWLVGLGAMVADAFYMTAVYIGLSKFLMYEGVNVFLWLFGCFVLIYTGVETIVKTRSNANMSAEVRKKETLLQSFQFGFFLSISNPLTILFWLGIYGSVLAKTITMYEPTQIWLYSCAIFLGIALWDFLMAVTSSTAKHFMSDRLKLGISYVSGCSLIGFGAYFGLHAIEILFY